MFLKLLALFIAIPVVELLLFLTVGRWIGWDVTLAIILATAVLGAWLTKRQGLQALARFRSAASEGRLPHAEVMDGLMILVAGALLLTPGFLTDTVGFLLLTPGVRRWVRPRLAEAVKRHVQVITSVPFPAAPGAGGGPTMRRVEGRVVEGEDERTS
jgi:UPF0716 protein FxsA